METVLQYLFDCSNDSECIYRDPNTIIFSINEFDVSLSFISEKVFKADFYIENIKPFIKFASKSRIEEFKISISESFEDREGGGKFDEQTDMFYFYENPNSIANTTFGLLSDFSKINDELILDYNFVVDDPYDEGFCGWHPRYFGDILIEPNKITLDYVKKIVSILSSTNKSELNKIYFPAYYKFKQPKNIFTEQFLNTNTKVRRLGYLKLFFEFINEKKKIPEVSISKKFEAYAQPFNPDLENASNNKGIIQNFSGQSAEPYITLLKEMDLITTINRLVVPTKWLKTFIVIRSNFTTKSENVFHLDELDKLFFLETILKTDYLYSSIILEFLFIREKLTTQELIKKFQPLLLNKLKKLTQQAVYKNEKSLNKIRDIERRVLSWKKAEVYLEHIIMPRINWLTDLGLLTFTENYIEVTENLKKLVIELNSWIDINGEYVADSSDFLRKYYPHIYAKSTKGDYGNYPDKTIIQNLCDEYINYSFSIFKTLAPNRVTSSQAFTFAKYCIYLRNGFSVSESFISKIVEEKLSHKYIYKYQSRYGDGYIQKIISN